jgi:hypothetical protein
MIFIGLAAWTLGLTPARADVGPTDYVNVHPINIKVDEIACQAGLKFGITPDQIPRECKPSLVGERNTSMGYREKWRYQGGFLYFTDGVLIAIRQMDP